MTATRPQGAPAPQCEHKNKRDVLYDPPTIRVPFCTDCRQFVAAPLAERQGQEVEKRIAVFETNFSNHYRVGMAHEFAVKLAVDYARRHFADLGASQQFSSTNIEGGRRFKQVLPNEDVGAQQQCTDRVEVPRRWVIAVNEFIEDWQKGDFNLPQLAALDAQAIIEAGADGPDLEACLNCGTDHSKGECRVIVAPASQDNPAPRCWCGRVLDDSAHLDNSLIHCEGEHGENKAHWFQPERRSGPAERRVTDLGCICAREKGRLHKYHDTTEPVSVRTGARDRRQPQAASFLEDLMEQKSDFDTSLDRDTQIERSALPGKERSQMDDIISLRNEINERSVDIAECAAPPLVTAAQAQQFRFRYAEKQQLRVMRSEFETTCMAAFASSLLAQRDYYVRRLELRLNEVPELQATLAQQQARLRELEAGDVVRVRDLTKWIERAENAEQRERILRNSESRECAGLRGLLREADKLLQFCQSPSTNYNATALRQRIQQANAKTEEAGS